MDPDKCSVFSRLSCMLMFLVLMVKSEGNTVDICARKGVMGTGLTIELKAGHGHTDVFCKCFMYNPGEVSMELILNFPRTRGVCSEYFIIKQQGKLLFDRCSGTNHPTSVMNELVARTNITQLSLSYSLNETRRSEKMGQLKLIVKSLGQKTNISVFCNPDWTTAAPTKRTALGVTTKLKPITTSSSATTEVSNPAALPTSNKPDVTTTGLKSRGRSPEPAVRPRSVAITTERQVTEGPTTGGTDIQDQAGSSGEPKRSVVGIQTFLIVIVVLSVVIFAFVIGAVVFFCRRKTPRGETNKTETQVIYAEPDKSNRLPRPRSKPDEAAYAASSDVSVEIPVPPKSWEVEGQIPRHSIMVDNVVYDSEND